MEQTVATEREDETVVAYAICNLLDLNAKESLPLIQQAFEDERVDEFVIILDDVEEFFDLPRAAARPKPAWNIAAESADDAEEDDTVPFPLPPAPSAPQPYVAALRVGRNDPCPCGSGKKYKKCCGAG